MQVGTIRNKPAPYSQFATVQDEYGMPYTVHASELATEDPDPGDDLAYRVAITRSSGETTLRAYDDES